AARAASPTRARARRRRPGRHAPSAPRRVFRRRSWPRRRRASPRPSAAASVPAAAGAGVALEVAHQALLVLPVAFHAPHQLGVAREERQVEQLRLGLLLGVDALLLVPLEL